MHTLSTLRFPGMNMGPTMTILDDFGEALYALHPTTSARGLVGSTLLQGRQRSALANSTEPLAINNSDGSCPIHHDDMFDGPTQEGPTEAVWYCAECGDGPIPDWNPCCSSCPYRRNGGCWAESPRHTHHCDTHGSARDGPSETVWYCGDCGDGPMQEWNPCCASCGHKKDNCCRTETK